jgi:N-acetylneuraminic acid mutarotase
MGWPPLEGMASGTINGKIYVIGGSNWGPPVNTTSEYDPALDAWTGKTAMPLGLAFPATAIVNDKLYVIKGAAIYEYTPDNDIL